MEIWQVVLAIVVTFGAGVVKGALGFALPMIMMSAFASFMSATEALALIILPVLITNIPQALRGGISLARDIAWQYRALIIMVVLGMVISSGFAPQIPQPLMFAALGVPITIFAIWQLSGRPMRMDVRHRSRVEITVGLISGLYGGLSGIWGPPIIAYLISVETPKAEQVRILGVVFLLGGIVLTIAHLGSGVLNTETLPLGLLMILPALAGMAVGFRVQDGLDLALFRRATLIVLAVSGLNLLRRALELAA